MTLHRDLVNGVHYAGAVARFWRAPVDGRDMVAAVRREQTNREARFLHMMEQEVFGHPASPYRPLLSAARVDMGDIQGLVRDKGIEGTLARLYEAGVHVTLAEFKGDAPIRRGGLSFEAGAASFDNPLARHDLMGTTGGSRSSGSTVLMDLREMLAEVPSRAVHRQAAGMGEFPLALWRSAPPSMALLRLAMVLAKGGQPFVKWFCPKDPGPRGGEGKGAALTAATVLTSWAMGHHIPWPEHVPPAEAVTIARWMAERTAAGRYVQMNLTVNLGVILCRAAREAGLDISGNGLRLSSEPVTEGKAALFAESGLSYSSGYGMNDGGSLGLSCGAPEYVDEMHVLTNRMACLPVRRSFPGLEADIDAIYLTVLSPYSPKVMLNVETGDYGTAVERTCGCPFEAAGLHQRLHTIRSYEKLTSAGMHFLGTALLDVLDSALPRQFGGGPTDYQFAEQEVDGRTVVQLVIAPSVGPLDEEQVVAFTLEELARRTRGGRMQAETWRSTGTLRVERRTPYITGAAKILPLHILRPAP